MAEDLTTFDEVEVALAASSGDATEVTFPVGTVAARLESVTPATTQFSSSGTDDAPMGTAIATIPGGAAEWVLFDPRIHGSPRPVLYIGSSMNNGDVRILPSRMLP